jgi:hypothetical protein
MEKTLHCHEVYDLLDQLCLPLTCRTMRTELRCALEAVSLDDSSGCIEIFYPSLPGGWTTTMNRVRRSVGRYSDRITEIRLLIGMECAPSGYTSININFGDAGRFIGATVLERSQRHATCVISGLDPFATQTEHGTYNPSPKTLFDAILSCDVELVKSVVAAGVSVDSITNVCVLEWAIAVFVAADFEHRPASQEVFTWISQRADWNVRSDGDTPLMMNKIACRDLFYVQHLLPWDRIDVHACDRHGNNSLHAYARSLHNSAVEFIGRLVSRGSVTLALSVNDSGQRPSAVAATYVTRNRLHRMERAAKGAVMSRLSLVIPIVHLVNVIMMFYTG